MTTLNDAQKQSVTAWIKEGLSLSQIQNRLAEEFAIRMTFLDVKLLVGDLNLVAQDREDENATAPAVEAAQPAQAALSAEEAAPAGGGRVAVEVDHLTKPGALVSGNVVFSDGKKAAWHLDQTGRLGLAGVEQGYRPPQGDMQEFQAALERELAKLGY